MATVWRDWLTESVMERLELNERQKKAITHVKTHGQITNATYQEAVGGSRRTALRELESLVQKGVLELRGKGRGAHYVLSKQCATNAPSSPK